MLMEIKRAYRFRFHPTPEQEMILAKTFGCARFAYNYMLRLRTDAWMQRQERIGYHETSAALTALKKQPEYAWLNEVSSVPVQQALRHLQTAFNNFFAKRARYPQYKRKDGPQSAEYTTSAFKWDGRSLKLAKMDAPLAIRWSRTIPKAAKVTTVTVSKDAAGRYFVSLLCDDVVAKKPASNGKVGVDLGLTHFAILSTGEKIAAPNTFRKYEAKLAKLTVEDLRAILAGDFAEQGCHVGVDNETLKDAIRLLWGQGVEHADFPVVEAYTDGDMPGSIRVAVAANRGENLDGHFGSCERFLIYQMGQDRKSVV